MSSSKIFVVCHKQCEFVKSDLFEPIQTGCAYTDLDLGILKDNQGDNIGEKNKNYGELTAWYWVWKNYLPAHPEVENIGFCHYRRVMDFSGYKGPRYPFAGIPFSRLTEIFKRSKSDDVSRLMLTHDILLPYEVDFYYLSVRTQFGRSHGYEAFDDFVKLCRKKHPRLQQILDEFGSGSKISPCLNFVMSRQMFSEMCEWMFGILFELESSLHLETCNDYHTIRKPAYLAERFMNIWILAQGCSIKRFTSYLGIEKEESIVQKVRRKVNYVLGYFGVSNLRELPLMVAIKIIRVSRRKRNGHASY